MKEINLISSYDSCALLSTKNHKNHKNIKDIKAKSLKRNFNATSEFHYFFASLSMNKAGQMASYQLCNFPQPFRQGCKATLGNRAGSDSPDGPGQGTGG